METQVATNSSILVELVVAITPLVLGILTVLVKQFAATRALRKSEERTKLAFGVFEGKLADLSTNVETLKASVASPTAFKVEELNLMVCCFPSGNEARAWSSMHLFLCWLPS